jgi:tetratricopeptide (TPR) repeat protein
MLTQSQLVTQARGLARRGRYEEARSAYRQAIAAMPRNPELLLELGVLAGQHGDLASARRSLEKALKLDRTDANIPFNLGQVAKAEGQNERAIHYFRQTLTLDPEYHEALFDLGEALYVAGRPAEALPFLDKAVAADPRNAEAHHVRALVLDRLERTAEAVAAYRKVLEIDPGHVNACLNLAIQVAQSGAPWEALDLVDAVEVKSDVPPEGYASVARVLHLVGEQERAAAYVEQSLAANVNVNEALMSRANIAIDDGDFARAEADLRRLLSDRKSAPWASYRLAFIKRLEPEAADQLERWADDESLSSVLRAGACFALYSLLDEAGEYDRAFEVLRRANDLKAITSPSNVASQIEQSARIARTFTPDFIAERARHGDQRPGAVFIVGMPRSGTTLTEQILAAHPKVYAGGERQDVARARLQVPGWPEGFRDLAPEAIARLGGELLAKMRAKAAGTDLATDKTPGNYVFLGLIASLLPNARLVYVRRHPGGNMLSLYEQNFLRGLNYSYDLATIAEVYKAHLDIMRHWTQTCGMPIHTVDYEALVSDPEPHIRALLAFLGLEFHPDCLRPEQVGRVVKTSSVWQVRQPIGTGSLARWKRYERQLAPYLSTLEDAP